MGRRPLVPKPLLDSEHGEVYQYQFTANRRRYRGSTGLRDYEAADAFIREIYANALKGKKPPRRERRYGGSLAQAPLVELFAAFVASLQNKKASTYLEKFESHFRSHFSHRWATLDELIRPGAIDAYASDRMSGKAPAVEEKPRRPRPEVGSSVTVAKELVTLRRFLKWCRKHGHIEHVPEWERVKPISDYQPPDYSKEEVEKLLAELPDRQTHRWHMPVREFFTVQWAQGLRPGELESLRWQDVNFKRQEMTVRQSRDKARVGRKLHLVPVAIAILEGMAKDALPSSLIFGKHSYQTALENASEALELARPTPHHFRHFRLTQLGNAPGTAPVALQAFAGHKHLSTTDRYLRTQAKAVKAMLVTADSSPVENTDPAVSQSKASRRKKLPRRAASQKLSARNSKKG